MLASPQEKIHTNHEKLKTWVSEMAAMCQPDKIVWIDGSLDEKKRLENQALQTGELIELDQKKYPGSFFHRSNANDVARTEHLTFICTPNKEDVGPTNNWMAPKDAYAKAAEFFKGAMKGRTMYVIPFSMGPVGSKFSKIGVELTDSIYVVLNMRIMTTIGEKVLKMLSTNGEFTKGLHSKADLNVNRRLIMHFPYDNTIWSVGSGYGGNVLLGKKCLALRIASFLGQKEGWMAEHMLILGIKRPGQETKYIAAAFPSACGKTNLAMLIAPKALKDQGYEIETVGDDIAWLHIDKDGSLSAINPESGFFGVLPGTNLKSNPNAVTTIKSNTIFTNALLTANKTIWWEGSDEPAPSEGVNWEGKSWKPGMVDAEGKKVTGAHPNSRFTAPIDQCPSVPKDRKRLENGVPISAIIFGGRRASLTPLVTEAFNWQHGVFLGATIASERTAAQVGKQGEVRYDPMAMLPFCGYHMGDYFGHWLKMGKKLGAKAPKIFCVNWFRQDEKGQFIWPGYGENLRVLEWILKRCEDKIQPKETPVGNQPSPEDINLSGLDFSKESMKNILDINKTEWLAELDSQEEFFKQFGTRFPKEISAEHADLKKRLTDSK